MAATDIDTLRALTPGCSQRTHLNNAGYEAADEITAVYASLS